MFHRNRSRVCAERAFHLTPNMLLPRQKHTISHPEKNRYHGQRPVSSTIPPTHVACVRTRNRFGQVCAAIGAASTCNINTPFPTPASTWESLHRRQQAAGKAKGANNITINDVILCKFWVVAGVCVQSTI